MKRPIVLACAAFWSVVSAQAQPATLRFGENRTFKIAQFTDMHLDPSTPRRLAQAGKTFARLDRILAGERPDLVVFTGDVVTGAPAETMWRRLFDTMERRGIPYCTVLGNHDAEQDLTRAEIGRLAASGPHSLNTTGVSGELSDLELEVLGRDSGAPALLLYCLDSHAESQTAGIEGYDWFRQEQIA